MKYTRSLPCPECRSIMHLASLMDEDSSGLPFDEPIWECATCDNWEFYDDMQAAELAEVTA